MNGEETAVFEAYEAMQQAMVDKDVDLMLLHHEDANDEEAYRAMEDAVAAGKIRCIGISNFYEDGIARMTAAASIPPAVLQNETHPYYQERGPKSAAAASGTVLESWFPLGHGDAALLAEPLFADLGAKYGKTPAQVILRWHIQEGNVIFPKSTSPAHIADNMDIFDFELTGEEMARIAELDKGVRYFNMTLAEQEANLGQFVPED